MSTAATSVAIAYTYARACSHLTDYTSRPLPACCRHPQGYKVLPPPAGYQPIYTPARKLMATPTPGMFGGVPGTPMYSIPSETEGLKQVYGGAEMPEGLPELKPEDQAVRRCCCCC